MTAQLELSALPVCDPAVEAKAARELVLRRLLATIRAAEEGEVLLDHCPEATTENLARNLGREFEWMACALSELRRRGSLVSDREWCGYLLVWRTSWMTARGYHRGQRGFGASS